MRVSKSYIIKGNQRKTLLILKKKTELKITYPNAEYSVLNFQ